MNLHPAHRSPGLARRLVFRLGGDSGALTSLAAAGVLAAGIAWPAGLSAQVLSEDNGGNGGAAGQGQQRSPQQEQLTATPGQQTGLGRDLPFFDPSTEVVTWDGRHWSVTDNRVFRARFEKYLASPAAVTDEDQAYRDLIDQILADLSPHREGGPSLSSAVALLPEAAQYQIDARLCDSLANAIWGVWMSQRNSRALSAANREMQQRRRQLEWNNEVAMEGTATQRQGEPRGGVRQRGDNRGNNNDGAEDSRPQGNNQADGNREQVTMELGRVSGYIKDIAELEARMKLNEAQMMTSSIQAKVEFQALIVQMFLQRRFEHVVMATRFYRNLFDDGDSQLYMEEGSDVESMFSSGLGFSPTIGTLDAFANEAIRDVDEAVQAFEELARRGDLDSASKRLSEAFVMGEYLPRVRRLPIEQKSLVLEYVRDSNQLISSIEVKDYELAEDLINRMREAARDFDYSKPRAMIETARTVSRMHLQRARTAAMQGDEDVVAREMRNATEIWPTNPELRELGEMIGKASDIQSQALLDFDRLYSQRNYRQIFNDQGRYAGAVVGDPDRQEMLREVIENVTRLNMAVNGAQQTADGGNVWGAWELVERTHQEFPEDPEISRMRSDLSIRAADFVAALERAKDFEARGQAGSSIAWYLRAKRTYPGSQFATEGVSRLVDDLRDEITDDRPGSGNAPGSSLPVDRAPRESDNGTGDPETAAVR